MVGPIDYRMDVLDPIQGYLQGLKFGEDVQTSRLGREATRQSMGILASQEARAAEQFQAQKDEAARKVAEAQSGQQALADLLANPNPTPDDFTRAYAAYPAIREEIKFLMTNQTSEQTRAQLGAAQNVYAAAAQQNPDVLRRILTEQRDAMSASGNEPMVKLLDEGLRLLEADPENAMQQLRASTGLTIIGLGGDLKQINEALGIVEPTKPTESVLALQQRAALAGLVPGTPEYNQFMISGGKTPEGMAIRTTPEGGIEFIQGAGAATQFREQESKDIVFAARAEGALAALDPVADQLAKLGPRLLEYVPLGQGRQFQDPLFQIANTAGLEFLSAILRKDTGAAITANEIEIYSQVYLPQPGDSAQVLAQKKEARRRALRALQAPMRPEAAEAVSGVAEGEAPPAAPAAPPAAFISDPTVQRLVQQNASVGVTVESIWNAMTAEEREAYGG